MACSSCSSGGGCGTKPGGCKSNGGCSTGGCNRLNVFDWLQDVEVPDSFAGFDIVEIRFKGGRKEFMRLISRNLMRLQAEGLLDVDAREIVVKDMKGLSALLEQNQG